MAFKILSVVGARPNLIKMAAIWEAIKAHNAGKYEPEIKHCLVHTGQPEDAATCGFFFNDIELPQPNLYLGIGSDSDVVQIAKIMELFEKVLRAEQPNLVIVVGHVNSTVACALATKKTIYYRDLKDEAVSPKLAHVEAGLRTFDRTMPEEVNRIVTDAISDYLFTTEESASYNLRREGISSERIYFVGNIMSDILMRCREKASQSAILDDLQLQENGCVKPYAILTMHRPNNVDDRQTLTRLVQSFLRVSQHMPLIFPADPRTLKRIHEADLGDYFVDYSSGPEPWDARVRIRLLPPLGYLDFVVLMSKARAILTDSAGVQEESTILGVPCITLRETTERPVTIQHGTSVLVGSDPDRMIGEFLRMVNEPPKPMATPLLWDGHAARRILDVIGQNIARPTEADCVAGSIAVRATPSIVP